jgi:DNA polymerase III alpha subunit
VTELGAAALRHSSFAIRVPISHITSLSQAFVDRCLVERPQGPFASLGDFVVRCQPGEAEAQALLDSGALDVFGESRPAMFWQLRKLLRRSDLGRATLWHEAAADGPPALSVAACGTPAKFSGVARDAEPVSWEEVARDPAKRALLPATVVPSHATRLNERRTAAPANAYDDVDEAAAPPVELTEPDVWQIARREMELLGFPITLDPLTLLGRDDQGREIDWSKYVPVAELGCHLRRRVGVCGLMVADRINTTARGDLMKFVTLADRTGFVEAILFPDAYQRFGHLTAAHPILAATGVIEPFESGAGFTLRVQHVSPPALRTASASGRPAEPGAGEQVSIRYSRPARG